MNKEQDTTNFEDLAKSIKPVPKAMPGGGQEGRKTPKQRKQELLNRLGLKGEAPVSDIDESVSPAPDPVQPLPELKSKKRRNVQPAKPVRDKIVISMELQGVGTYRTPAYDVIDANYGILVILPRGNSEAVFIPSAGSEVTICMPGGKKYKCFYPGISAELRSYDSCVLAFVKADENA